MFGSTVDTYSASARVTFGRIPGFLREWVDSALEVDSRPALLSSWPRTSSTTAVACFQRVLLVIKHLALCSQRLLSHRMEKCAQSMLRPPRNNNTLGMVLSIFSLPVLLRLVSGGILLLLLGLGLVLPLLSNLAGPVQHFRVAVLDAWRNKITADICGRAGFRGGPLLDIHGSLHAAP